MKPPVNLYLATSTGCNVRCKSCPAGRVEPESGGVMSMDMLRRILDKFQAESRVLGVQLYHYNEPTLIPHMHLMVRECHERGLPVFLSSNFVVWKNIPNILAEAPEMFLISVSGWTQEIYERSHRNGDIEAVKKHMAAAARLKQPGTTLQLSWHRYRYNEHELPLMEEYATSLGMTFVPYGTSLIPHDRAMRVWATGEDDYAGADVLVPVKEARQLCADRRWFPCLLQDQVIAVNGQGRLLLCSNFMDDGNLRGDLFGTTIEDFLKSRKTDKTCIACKSVGGHVYALQAYTRSPWSPLLWAEFTYRKLKLQGRFPALTAWALRHYYKLSRPQEKTGL